MDPRRASYPPDPFLDVPPLPRPIPPSSMPSLSSGQGFYTVESLQGATVVPPLAPPPSRLPEPFLRDRFDPLPQRPRILPDDPPFGLPHPHLDRPHLLRGPPRDVVGPVVRGFPALQQHPPPFMADPRIPGFQPQPGRERGWWPYQVAGVGGRPMQRPEVRKQVQKPKPVPQPKASLPAGALGEKSSAGKQIATEEGPGWCSLCKINCYKAETLKIHLAGKKHKRNLEATNVEAEGTKKLDGDDQVVNKVDEETKKSEGDNEAAKDGEASENVDAAATLKDSNTTAPSKKRENNDKEGSRPTRKRRKSAVSSDAQNATVAVTEEKEDKTEEVENSRKAEKASDALQVCELCNVTCTSKSMLENHFKGKKHAARLKKALNKPRGDSEGAKEGGDVMSLNSTGELANGNAGQSAEVQ